MQERYNLSLKVNCRKTNVEDKYEQPTKIVKVSSNINDANLIPHKNAAELPKRLHRADTKVITKQVSEKCPDFCSQGSNFLPIR